MATALVLSTLRSTVCSWLAAGLACSAAVSGGMDPYSPLSLIDSAWLVMKLTNFSAAAWFLESLNTAMLIPATIESGLDELGVPDSTGTGAMP